MIVNSVYKMERQFTIFLIILTIGIVFLKKNYADIPSDPKDQVSDVGSSIKKEDLSVPDKTIKVEQVSDNFKTTLGAVTNSSNLKKNGLHILMYDNGKKKEEGQYRDNVRTGLWTWWYENGNKWQQGEYSMGERNNTWHIWKKDGAKWKDIVYDNGNFITKKEY